MQDVHRILRVCQQLHPGDDRAMTAGKLCESAWARIVKSEKRAAFDPSAIERRLTLPFGEVTREVVPLRVAQLEVGRHCGFAECSFQHVGALQ